METSTKIKIAAAFAILAGPFMTYTGHQERTRLAGLEKDGITVAGEILSGESERRRRSSSYQFEVEYRLANGGILKRDFKVTSDFFKAHAGEHLISDPAVQVRYLPRDPHGSAIIVGGSTDDAALFPIGIGLFVVGLGTIGFMAFRRG